MGIVEKQRSTAPKMSAMRQVQAQVLLLHSTAKRQVKIPLQEESETKVIATDGVMIPTQVPPPDLSPYPYDL